LSLPRLVIDALADRVVAELADATVGHCIRVDHLERKLAHELNDAARGRAPADVETYVLSTSTEDGSISHQRAIELRNRKRSKLCLFVPGDVGGNQVSSLENSFAAFDLEGAFHRIGRDLEEQLSPPVRMLVKRVRSQLTGSLRVNAEQWLDLLGHVVEAPIRLGAELWRVGLIPDTSGELEERIDENARTVRAIAHPPRPQSSVPERLDTAGVTPGEVRTRVLAALGSERLRDRSSWTRRLGEVELPFAEWPFEEVVATDLDGLEVTPFLKADGTVEGWSKLVQKGGVGTQPFADASGGKVTIRWKTHPPKPENVARWRIELVPAHDDAAALAELVELPITDVAAGRRSVTLELDLDLENVDVPEVRVRVAPLDELGRELSDASGQPFEARSSEFWLEQELEIPTLAGSTSTRKETVPSEMFGRLRLAARGSMTELAETASNWTNAPDDHGNDEPVFWTSTIDRRHVLRVLTSPILNALEVQVRSDETIALRGTVSTAGRLDPTTLSAVAPAVLQEDELGQAVLRRRQEVRAILDRSPERRHIAAADWSGNLASKIRSYAAAYRDALNGITDRDALGELLQLDTVQLTLEDSASYTPVSLVAPSHPARLLWTAAHRDLLATWEEELLATPAKERRQRLDLVSIQRIEPTYSPPVLLDDREVPLLHVQNLLLYWGVALPFDLREPGRTVSLLAEMVGLEGEDASMTDLPPSRLARDLQSYRDVHPYLDTLRIDAVTPGSAAYLAASLRALLKSQLEPDSTTVDPLRLDLATYLEDPVPATTPELERLSNDVYEAQPRGRRSHLAPFFSYGHHPAGDLEDVAERDVHLTLLFDRLRPAVAAGDAPPGTDSSSFYGLLTSLVSTFELAGEAKWRHWLAFPDDATREKHPAHGPYTANLVEVQRLYGAALARRLGLEGSALALDASLPADDITRLTAVHDASDWVMTIDRFLGIELYDAPRHEQGRELARTYLIDHSPEFLDGIGHRMVVSTTHRGEVEEILDRAMGDLGFSALENSVGQVLDHLKTVSGRLALRIVGDENRAREAVSLGVVVALLRARGQLENTVVVPVDAHPELFGVAARTPDAGPRRRCDLILFRAHGRGLTATFVEVKARSAGRSRELMLQMADQMAATEEVFRDLFFRPEGDVRLDHVLQRSRLASILRFYTDRAERHGLFTAPAELERLQAAVGRLTTAVPELKTDRHGYIINLAAAQEPAHHVDQGTIELITAGDITDQGLALVPNESVVVSENPSPRSEDEPDSEQPGASEHVDIAPQSVDGGESVIVAPWDQKADDGRNERTFTSADDRQVAEDPRPYEADTEPESAVLEVPESPADDAAKESGAAEVEIELGIVSGDQDPVVWRPSVRGSPHLFVLGIPGQGKSWTVTRLLQELSSQDVPAIVFDFHGQFGDPNNQYVRSSRPRVVDVAEGLPFSPFEADPRRTGGGWQSDCFEVAEIFEYVCDLGEIQKDAVYEALRNAYEARGFGRSEEPELPTISEVRAQLEEIEVTKRTKNLVSRTRPLLEFGLFSNDVETNWDLMDAIEGGLVFDVHGLRLETLQLAAGAFVLRKLYKDMFHWGEADRLRCVIVLDEAHRLAKDVTLPKIMKEGRKFGVGVVVASQGLNDFHPDVLGNAGSKVVFRTNHPSSRKVGGFLKGPDRMDVVSEIEQLTVGQALVQTPDMPYVERVLMHPLES
jgi:DNA phosphorothioation-dependent restriction protein DptH